MEASTRPVARATVAPVVGQHVEEAIHLRHVRTATVRAPHVRLLQLSRLDERIAAHLDGIVVAGAEGLRVCNESLSPPGCGAVFAAMTTAIATRDSTSIGKLLAIGAADEDARRGVLSAFGWVSAAALRGITKPMLDSADAWWREVAIAACAMHRVDPGAAVLDRLIDDRTADRVSVRAATLAASLGHTRLRDACSDLARSELTPPMQYKASLAALCLGDRAGAVDVLRGLGSRDSTARAVALASWLKVSRREEASALLSELHTEPAAKRTLVAAIGVAGDPHHVPWLIACMDDLALTRLAGESFSLITGLDLAYLDLDRKPPEGVETGPNDDPQDADVSMDEDEGLPWPDQEKIAAWWHRNGARFTPGARYFMGQPPSPAHSSEVLRIGFQRQRAHAAEYLCLLQPGTPLFNIAAPAWRQQRLLA